MRIAVVGGSITGCAFAASLRDHGGFDVEVFERSPNELRDRGAGIVAPVPVINSLRERDLVDRDMPLLETDGILNTGKDGRQPTGRMAWRAPVPLARLRWNDLYRSLRRRVSDDQFHHGREVLNATAEGNDSVALEFTDHNREIFDLVLFADGYRSRGRRILFPDSQLAYQGYTGLRGVLPEASIDDSEPLEDSLYRISYSGGHFVFYLVAGEQGEVLPGHRLLNWGVYIQVPSSELGALLTDRNGQSHFGSVPFGRLPQTQISTLLDRLSPELPPYFAQLIRHPDSSYALQAMFACDLPAYRRGRIGLAGDAGMIAPPFTGSGVFKGITNATTLADLLLQTDDVDDALSQWDASQTELGRSQIALGKRLEDALIWNIPDFSSMSEADMTHWWENAAKFPDEIWQEKENAT